MSLFLRLWCRTRARSRVIVNEAGNGATELRRRRNCPGRVDHDDKVRLCRNGEGVGGAPKRCSQTHYSGIAKVVLAQVCWIVAAQICRTFNISTRRAWDGSIDRDSVAGMQQRYYLSKFERAGSAWSQGNRRRDKAFHRTRLADHHGRADQLGSDRSRQAPLAQMSGPPRPCTLAR